MKNQWLVVSGHNERYKQYKEPGASFISNEDLENGKVKTEKQTFSHSFSGLSWRKTHKNFHMNERSEANAPIWSFDVILFRFFEAQNRKISEKKNKTEQLCPHSSQSSAITFILYVFALNCIIILFFFLFDSNQTPGVSYFDGKLRLVFVPSRYLLSLLALCSSFIFLPSDLYNVVSVVDFLNKPRKYESFIYILRSFCTSFGLWTNVKLE